MYFESRINIRRIEILWRVNKEGSRRRELLFAYRGNRFIIRSRSGNRVLCAKWHGEPPAERERERVDSVCLEIGRRNGANRLPSWLPSIDPRETGESELDRVRAMGEEHWWCWSINACWGARLLEKHETFSDPLPSFLLFLSFFRLFLQLVAALVDGVLRLIYVGTSGGRSSTKCCGMYGIVVPCVWFVNGEIDRWVCISRWNGSIRFEGERVWEECWWRR